MVYWAEARVLTRIGPRLHARNGAKRVSRDLTPCSVFAIRLIHRIEQKDTSMNIFPCHQVDIWQCEWHDDCKTNFTLQASDFSVIIRDNQQPNAPNAIEFADPNAKFVAANQTTLPTCSASPASTQAPATSSALTAGAKAGIAVGVAVGSLLVALLIFSLSARWRQQKLANGSTATDHVCAHCGHGEVGLTGQPQWTEMDAAGIKSELTAQTPRWEMDDGRGLDR